MNSIFTNLSYKLLSEVHKDNCTKMFTAALFVIAKQPKWTVTYGVPYHINGPQYSISTDKCTDIKGCP